MRKLMIVAVAGSTFTFSCGVFGQGQVGTAPEAKAMLEKAVIELKSNEAAALAKFNNADGGFRDRDLYVYCFDVGTGKFTAHVNPTLMGTDVRALKEKDGSPLGQKGYDAVKEGTIATISYNFPKPGSTDPVPKEAYITRVSNQGCGVGYYKVNHRTSRHVTVGEVRRSGEARAGGGSIIITSSVAGLRGLAGLAGY